MTNGGEKPASRSVTPEPVGLPMPPEGMRKQLCTFDYQTVLTVLLLSSVGNLVAYAATRN